MGKKINLTLVNIVLILVIVSIAFLGFRWIAVNINFGFFGFGQKECAYNYLGDDIDPNAYIIDISNNNISIIQEIYNLQGDPLREIKSSERAKVDLLNLEDISYLRQHPEWRYENLTKLGKALEDMGADSANYDLGALDLDTICPR